MTEPSQNEEEVKELLQKLEIRDDSAIEICDRCHEPIDPEDPIYEIEPGYICYNCYTSSWANDR